MDEFNQLQMCLNDIDGAETIKSHRKKHEGELKSPVCISFKKKIRGIFCEEQNCEDPWEKVALVEGTADEGLLELWAKLADNFYLNGKM